LFPSSESEYEALHPVDHELIRITKENSAILAAFDDSSEDDDDEEDEPSEERKQQIYRRKRRQSGLFTPRRSTESEEKEEHPDYEHNRFRPPRDNIEPSLGDQSTFGNLSLSRLMYAMNGNSKTSARGGNGEEDEPELLQNGDEQDEPEPLQNYDEDGFPPAMHERCNTKPPTPTDQSTPTGQLLDGLASTSKRESGGSAQFPEELEPSMKPPDDDVEPQE
jgi:hypothetical protein